MKNISHLLLIYRECARNLWNVYFYRQMSSTQKWDMKDKFDRICTMLFSSLVLDPIDKSSYKKSHSYEKSPNPLDILNIVPSCETGVPIQINRDIEPSAYWDYPLEIIKPNDADLKFIDFFDFDVLGIRDFEYYLVRINGSVIDSELKGRNALIKTSYANVILK